MEDVISLEEIFDLLKKKSKFIILLGLAGISITGLYTFFMVTPKYESSSKIVVNQTQNSNQTLTNNDIQTNLNLINTYQSIIQEPIILEDVIKKTNLDLTLSELRNKISVQTQTNSLVFSINVVHENPYEAALLANAVAGSFEEKIGDILEVQSVTILSEAVPNLSAVSPNILMNIMIGLMLGLISGIAYAFLSEYLDNTIKGSHFINENIGWTDLGAISLMTEKELKDMAVRQEEQKIESRRGRRVV